MTKFNNKKSFDEIKSERKSQSGISFKFDGDTETVPKDTAATSGKKFENTRSFDDIKLSRAENALSMKKRILSAKRNKIANDYNNYAAEIGKRRQAYSGNGYVGTSEDDYLFAKQKKEEAERDINNLKTGYLTNPSAFSEELAWIDDIEKIYNDSAENFKKLNEFYSQFGDENTYDVYTMIPDDYQKKIDDLQAEIDVLKGSSGKSNALRYNKDESYRNSVRNAVAKMADNGELGPDSNRVKELIEKEDRLKQMQKNLDLRKYYDKTAKAYADLDFTSKDAILSAMNESNDNEVKEWLQYKYDSLLSSEELRNIANNTTDSEKRAYYNQFADDKYKKEAKEILSNSKMNGENISVFDALNKIPSLQKEYESIYSETEGGPPNPEQVKRLKELSDRISSIKKAVEDLGVDYNSVYSYFTGDSNVTGENFGGFLVNSVYSGLNQYNKGLFSSLDWLLGGTVDGFNEMFRQWTQDNFGGTGVQLPNYLHDLNDYYTRALSDNNYELNKVIDNMGGGEGWEISGKIISGTVAALPDAILAFMSTGASTVATSTASLSTKAAYATSDILGKAGITAQTMAKNPFYWTSFAREAGINYEEALQAGADNATASFTATITSLINAGIEIGVDGMSGIQGLPKNLLSGDKSAVASWVKSMISEGKEEVLQGIVQNLVAKASYDSDKDWLGIDGTAVFDLTRGLEEFGMGAAVSGILGGGPTILNSVFSRNSNVSQYDTLLENQGKRVSYMGNEILDFALKNTNLQYTSQALSRIADVNNMSYRDLGLLYLAEMVDTQVQFADSQTSEQIDTVADSFIADGEMAKYINESRSIYKQRLENNVNDYYSKQYVKSDNVSFPFKSSSDVETTTEGSFLSQNPIFNNNLSLDIQHKNNYNIFEDKATPAPATNSEHNNIVTARDNNGNPVRIYRISEINEDGSFSLKTPDGIISSEDISDGSLLKHLDFIRENGLDIAAANSYLRHINGDPLYGEAYNSIYQSAKSGLKDFDRVKSSMPALVNVLGEKTAFAAFNLGKHAAGIDAKTQITKLDVIPQGKYSKSVSEKKTADTKTRDFLLKHIAEKSGLDIELSSLPYGENANFIANAARIVLSIESKNIIGSLFHETGEAGKAYAPKEYEDFKINLVRWWLSNKGSEYYGGKVKLYKDVYEINGVITSYQNASDELVCDAIGGLFADENGAKSLFNYLEHDNMHTIKEKVKILEKINEIFQKIIGRIKALFAGMKLNSTQKTMLEADLDIAEQLRQKYYAMLDAMREKLKTMSQDGSDRQNNDIDIRHSIETTKNGKQYVKADRQVITGNNPTVWKQQIYSYINNTIRQGKDVVVYAADGDALTITEDTAGKARFRNMIKTANGQKYRMTDSEFAAKLRAESQIDELTAVSVRGNITVPDYKNHKFAKNGFNYRTAYFMDNDGQYYKITISVGKNGNINTVYNVGKIEEAHFPLSGSKAKGVISRRGNSTSSIGNSIPQKNGSVNSQYSQNSKKNTRHQFDIDDNEIDVDEIDFSALENYTKRTYDKFGWVRVNKVLNYEEHSSFMRKLGELKSGIKFNKDYFGNYIIPVGETPGVENVLVYTDGKFIEPNIEKVVRINSDDATEIDYYERKFIDYGRDLSKGYAFQEIRGKEIFIEYTKGEYGSYGQVRAEAKRRNNGKTNNRNIGDDKFGGGSDTSYQLDVSEHNNGKGTEENGVRYQLDIFEETDNDEDISYNKEKGAEGNERNEKGLLSESGNGRRTHIEILQPQYYRRGISGGEKTNRGISEFRRITKGRVSRQIDSENRTELTYESDRVKRVYKFKNIPVQKASSEAQKAYNLFNKAGLETYVIDIDSYKVHENGKIKNGNFYALTACNGQVILINNNLKADFAGSKELFVHEKIHIDLKSNDPRVRERAEIFHDTVLKNIAENSIVYKKFFECFMYPYINNGKSHKTLAEELTAFVSTVIAFNDGELNGIDAKMFKDTSPVLDAWHNIFDEYNLFENQPDTTDAIDSGEAITYNEEKGVEENGDEKGSRQNRRGNSGRRAENSLYNSKRYIDLSEPSYFRGRTLEKGKGISQRSTRTRVFARNGRTEIEYSYPNGSYICSFKEVFPKKYSSEIKIAVRLFERTNVDCYVFANRTGVDIIEDGETENIPCYGVTVCEGQMVLLNNTLEDITGRGIFFHEMLHVGLLSEDIRILNSFEDFHDTVLKNIIPDNYIYGHTINYLSDNYDINDTEVFAEEFVALISEKIGSNDNWEYYSKMFKNPDEVRTAWAEAFKNYLPEDDDVRYQLDIPEDIDNNEDIAYNKEKGVNSNEREDNTRNSAKGFEILQSRRLGRGYSESNRRSKGRYERNRTEQGQTRLTYDTGNNIFGYEFENVPGPQMSARPRRASELFTKAGIESYVFNPESAIFMSKNEEREKRNCNAVTVCGGQVILISNNLEKGISGNALFAHEIIHSYLKSSNNILRERAEVLHDTILQNINPFSEYYITLIRGISRAYSNVSDIKFAEEVVAFISADIADDIKHISDENFSNPQEVLRAWNRMFAEFGLPENNTDRRYQFEIPDYTDPEELKSVIRQNEKYKKLTEYLRTEVKRTYGKIVKPNYTKFVAATLKEEYNCSLPKEEIVEMLDGFYGYLSKEKKSSDYSLSKTYAEEIARNILESSSDKREITDFAKTVLSDIRKLNVTLNEEQRDEVAYSYGTYGEYRRKNFGRFTVSNSGVNIEVAWDELAERYPSVFEKDTNPAEMPLKLVEITDMLSDGYDSGDGLTYEDEVEALSSELIQRYIEAPRRETFADKKYDEYKDSLKKVREELKADYKERLAKVRQTSKEKTSEAMLRQKAKYEGQILRARSRKVESEYREKIRKTVSRLTKKLTHPAEGKYVPKNLVKVTAEILSEINLDTGRGGKASEKLSQLKTVYDSLKNDPVYNVVYDEVIADMIQTLSQNVGSVSVSDMTEANLRQTYEVLKSLEHMINNAVKVRGIETEKNIFEFAKELINETSLVNKSVLTDSPIASWLNAQSRAQVMFERLAGYKKDSYWLKLYEMLNKAQLKETQIEMEGSQLFAELLRDKKQLKTLTDTKNLIDIGLKDENGNPVKITRGMMLSIRDSLRNEDNIRHITYGGYTVPVLKDYYKGNSDKAFGTGSVKVGGVSGNINVSELIKTIDENLNEYELKWLEAGRKFFDEFSKNKINEATNEMYGFEKARVSNYFPIHTSSDYLKANFESITRDMSLENSGFIKDRIKASSPLILEDYTAVINSQLKKVAKYAAMTPAVKTFNKIYGKTESGYANSAQAAINSKFGNGGKKYIENLLSDIVGSRKGEITFFDKLRGNMAQATLSLNPRVTIVQTASYPTAAAEIGYKPLIKALIRKDSDSIYGISRADRELIAKYSPLLWYRSQGNSNIELGDIKEMSKTQNIVMRKMRFLMGWINAMDSATVGRLWYAAQYYVEDNFKELTPKSDAFYEKTAEVFNNIIEKTQPNYTTMQRPDILRNPNALVRQLTMFLTQRLQNMNILYDATARYKKYKRDFKGGRNGVTEDDVKTARKKLKNAVSSQVAAAVTITIMKALCDMLLQSMYNYRDKDKEVTTESLTLGMIDSFSESVISNFLFGSELYGLISSIAFDDKYYGVSMNGVDTFTEVLENLVTTSNDLSFDNFVSLGNSVATFLGIPSKNAIKIGKGMYYWYTDITNGNAFSFKASGGTASTKSKLGKALKYSPESKDFKLQIDKILEDKETELYEKKIKEGYKEEYAKEYAEKNRESSVKSSMTSLLKEEYVSASSERKAEIRKYMYKSGLYGSVDDVISTCDRWTADYEEEQKKKK